MTASYRWLDALLTLLYERHDPVEALALLRDDGGRERALADLSDELIRAGAPLATIASDHGAQLFVAVLTLRVKFPVEEAREKVALNIAMREGRR